MDKNCGGFEFDKTFFNQTVDGENDVFKVGPYQPSLDLIFVLYLCVFLDFFPLLPFSWKFMLILISLKTKERG